MVVGSTDGGLPWGVIDRGGGSIDIEDNVVRGGIDDSVNVVRGGIEDCEDVGRGGGGSIHCSC